MKTERDLIESGVMSSKTYYFIDSGINPDSIYGDGYPVCLDEAEVQRLSREWDTDLFEQMHEASAKEIAEYGVYDSPVNTFSGDPSDDRPETVIDGIDYEQKDKIKALADKYGMEIMRNSITSEAGGVTIFSPDLIPELDALADAEPEAIAPCACLRERFPGGEGYRYKIYCPPEWFDLWGWR